MTIGSLHGRFRVRLFGTIEVESRGRRLGARDFGGSKPRQVLEILLLARGHPVPKDRLADLIWGERLPRNANAVLENYVSMLRKRLTPDRRQGRELIVTEHEAYRFAVATANVDLDRFDELIAQSEREDAQAARDVLEEAIGLARGELLEDEPYAEWAEEPRRRYRERLVQALVRAAEAALADDDYAIALDRAERALATEPAAEAAGVAAMLALHALCRTNEALLLSERVASALVDGVGAEPAPETRALHEAIRRREDPRVLLVTHLGGPSIRRHQPTPLVGRSAQLATLAQHLRDALAGAFSLALVEGAAGVGKSRLLDEALRGIPSAKIGRARCSPLERELPYSALAMALRDALTSDELAADFRPALAPILPELGPPKPVRGFPKLATLESLAQLVREHAPLVLVLDDLQWVDESSVVALDYLQRRIADAPIAVAGAVRSEDVAADHPLRLIDPTARIALAQLEPEALDRLGVPGLYEQTLGHPPLVALALADSGRVPPPALLALVQAWCRTEGSTAFRALASASVLEQPFRPDLLAAVLGEEPAELAELLERLSERRLLRVEGDGFGYCSEPLREVLFATLSPARRRLLERQARSVPEQRTVEELAPHE